MTKFDFIKTDFEGCYIIIPHPLEDYRGWFAEVYNRDLFSKAGINNIFVQDNHSFSPHKSTLRGLYYQSNPHAQAKLVRCTRGQVLEVGVDLRKSSKTYGKYFSLKLSAQNRKILLLPKGFAHGFLTLEDDTEYQYKTDHPQHPPSEKCIAWDDPTLAINWGVTNPILSEKSASSPPFNPEETYFK